MGDLEPRQWDYGQLLSLFSFSGKRISNIFKVVIFRAQFSSVQSLSRVRLFATPWIAACQAFLSITNFWNSPKLMYMELVMPSSHLILCRPLLLLPPIPPSIRVFSNESTLRMRWPKYWSFSFKISPSNENPGLVSFIFFYFFYFCLFVLLLFFFPTTILFYF